MPTIKIIQASGLKRVLLKTVNGAKRVSCSCCGAFDFAFDIEERAREGILYHCGVFATVDPFDELLPPELLGPQANDGKRYKNVFGEYEDPWLEGNTLTVRNLHSIDPVTFTCSSERTYNVDINQDPYDDGSTFNYISAITFSEEDAPADLRDRIIALINGLEFSEWDTRPFAPSSEGFHQLGAGFTGIIREKQLRLKHTRTATGYLKMWLLKRSYEWDINAIDWINPSDEDFDEYEWNGEPLNNSLPLTDPANLIIGEPIDIPYEDGIRNDIYPFKWSFIEGYEPDDPVAVLPFPETTRPDPDCYANGIPVATEGCA